MISKVAPSILAADFLNLKEDISKVEAAGADLLHLDVMDGGFVPPISFGQDIIKKIRKCTRLPLDVHLMIREPEKHIKSFAEIGIEYLTFHLEAVSHPFKILEEIRSFGVKSGIAINPGTPVQVLEPLFSALDLILIMTVNPGWGGQAFISTMLEKIRWIKSHGDKTSHIKIEVDGGINKETGLECYKAGAEILVAGTFIFNSSDYAYSIKSLKFR